MGADHLERMLVGDVGGDARHAETAAAVETRIARSTPPLI